MNKDIFSKFILNLVRKSKFIKNIIMKKISATLIFIGIQIFVTQFSYSQSGSIVFQDGSNIKFKEIIDTYSHTLEGASSVGKNMFVVYQNANQMIPWSTIKSFEILSVSRELDAMTGDHNTKAEVNVITKTGINVTYKIIFNFIKVSMFNELTGDIREQIFQIVESNRLNVKKILID